MNLKSILALMKKQLFSKIYIYLQEIRINQWLKNIFVFVPLLFSKNLFDDKFFTSVQAFFCFSIASSILYVINDLFDISLDKNHPFKKNRPIASGSLSKPEAYLLILILAIMLFLLLNKMNFNFIVTIILFLTINILYSIWLKNVSILDIILISAGFMIRVISGALAIDVSISSWLILTTLFLSLFLAINKRIAELKISSDYTRKVLKFYSIEFLNQISAISTAGLIMSYSLYTVSDRTIAQFGTENLAFTVIFVVFGIFRYILISQKDARGENIIDTIIHDFPSILNMIFYISSVMIILY